MFVMHVREQRGEPQAVDLLSQVKALLRQCLREKKGSREPKNSCYVHELAMPEPFHILFPFGLSSKARVPSCLVSHKCPPLPQSLFHWVEPDREQGQWSHHSRPACGLGSEDLGLNPNSATY